MIRSIAAVLVSGFLCAGVAAQTFSANPSPTGQNSPNQALGGCGTAVLTQSTSNAITAGNSVSCNAGGLHAENSYYRAFAVATGFTACAIEVGIETANAGDPATTQPATINIYSNVGGSFPAGTATVVGTASVSVADQAAQILTVPITGTVPSGAQLVAEVLTPDGQTAGHSFFIGSNAAGQSGPSFLRAPACGINAPTTTTAIGFPDMHIVLNVRGTAGPAPAPMITVSPAGGANFGSVTTGTTSTSTVTLTNTGNVPVTITAITPATAPFSLVTDNCTGQTLAPTTGTCTVTYRFSPTANGPFTQALTVTSNAPPVTITLQGTGAPPPVAVPGPGLIALILLVLGLVGFGAWRTTRA